MNPDLSRLHPYPFERLKELRQDISPPSDMEHISLSIGEPRHQPPHFVVENLIVHTHLLSSYPLTRGSHELRTSISNWLNWRFELNKDIHPESQVLPVNGTREALFAIAQCVIDRNLSNPLVLMPNPFYQIYEGAALLGGGQPVYMNCLPEHGFLPVMEHISDQQWRDCQLIYICTPGNPSGAVMPKSYLQTLIELAHRFNFIIASDECYSEIYFDESNPPPGLLAAASDMGVDDYKHCLVFHSLSKRSNLPGLRSGFVAGDAEIIKRFLLYRTYHGCAMSPPTQSASNIAWQDEQHVIENRQQYREKFDLMLAALSDTLHPARPDAGFYFWTKTEMSDTEFARQLFARQNISVLPGQFLSRQNDQINPGTDYVRIALVAQLDECLRAAKRINQFFETL